MFQFKKTALAIASLSLGILLSNHLAYAADTKVTTATPVTTTTSITKEGDVRKVLDEDALKKMADGLCVEGFKAYVGNDNKNICQGQADAPDIAYSCVWHEDGNAAFAPTPEGPCSLDFVEHRKSLIVTKNEYTASPPLPYGTEAHCCFRAAQGPATSTVEVKPTAAVKK